MIVLGTPCDLAAEDCNGNVVPDADETQPSFGMETLTEHGLGVDYQALWFAAGDVDLDGRSDLVVLQQSNVFGPEEESVWVYSADDDGRFSYHERVYTSTSPLSHVALGDIDGDGALDILVNSGRDVLWGNGDASFRGTTAAISNNSGSALVLADLNGDDRLDLVGLGNESIVVALNDGLGRFPVSEWVPIAVTPFDIAAADVNGDGFVDIVTANPTSQDVSVLLGNGAGLFAPERRFFVGSFARYLAVGDFNSDGRADVVVANGDESSEVSVLLGSGEAIFEPERRLEVSSRAFAVAVADLDGDGDGDLAIAVPGRHTGDVGVAVLLGNGDGSFQEVREVSSGLIIYQLLLADFNGDGSIDIAGRSNSDAMVLLGNGDGSFRTRPRVRVGLGPRAVAMGDLDLDGRTDVVTANYSSNDVSVLLGRGDGTFLPETRAPAGARPASVALADLNGDRILDIATANEVSNDVSVIDGSGDGSFPAERRFGAGVGPRALAVGDLNGDGHADITTANERSSDVSLLLGDGTGSFVEQQRVATSAPPRAIALGDLDADGRIDITTVDGYRGLGVLLARGDGSFEVERRYELGFAESYPVSLAIGDLNTDGLLDVAVVGALSGEVFVMLGQEGGPLRVHRSAVVGTLPLGVVIADFDGDLRPDIAASNSGSKDVSILLGNGDGSFRAQRRYPAGFEPGSLAAGDLDNDGRADIAVTDAPVASLGILLNRPVPSALDCDLNGVPDECDIDSGRSADCNANAMPDECESDVRDVLPPRIGCFRSIEVECSGLSGAVVEFSPFVEDFCDPAPLIECTPPSGSVFPPGVTTVQCLAIDASGNRAECSFEVRVACGGGQVPGDCNQDGGVDLSDAVCVLGILFFGSSVAPCDGAGLREASNIALLDWNADGAVDISDGVAELQFLFTGGREHGLGRGCVPLSGCPHECGA
jgi:hypothetical protein